MGFGAHVRIRQYGGVDKPCEGLLAGDTVLEAATGLPVTVAGVIQGPGVGMIRVTAANGEIADVTGDQAFATTDGVFPADALRPGQRLHTVRGPVECSGTEYLAGDFMVYDPRVSAPDSTVFVFANGFMAAVHG